MLLENNLVNTIIHGNCSDIMQQMSPDCIDLVMTDPPYRKEFLHTYKYLANECPRIMRRGASLLAIAGHFAIPQIIKYFDGKLKYRWIICMNQFEGSHSRMAMGIEVMWKPILWYVKESYPAGRGFLRDGIKIEGKAGQKKANHEWEQDLDWCLYYIEKLTVPGDVVLDPFIGSGTVAVACKKLNRSFIGIEIDEKYCEIARNRINSI